ncbi:single-stranded-DNA-specific exonuclease RecJ [bacterium]|nr:single-stranded-DNA-specific exonuclease RecJ [bacterium]
MKKEWIFDNTVTNEKSLIKRLLFSRGITTEDEIHSFLNPLEMDITSPYVFSDMEKTVERLSKAIDNKETIVIYGDFDADGVTSTSVLYKAFKELGADVKYYIPDRESEGHGFDKKALIKLMTTIKPKVIISVDCGISDVDAIKFINSFKIIDVIITDHHEAPEVLPEAYAIINPKAPNALDESLSTKQIEHLTYLAGCGVAFKVAQALLVKYERAELISDLLPFVAVGTISDIVPLLGENRCFVTKGLELISKGRHEGLKKLLESAGYDITKGVTSENIAFGVSPRINASGRLDTVDAALKVLISDNPQEVQMSITTLNELNKIRQTLCQEIFLQADEMVKKEGNKNPAIVLCNEGWHIGIIGIVASKLVEKYYKPVFMMTYSREKNEYRCSARSIEGVPLYDVLCANAELFEGFGGHKLAAGLSFSGEKTPFETVKRALCETVKEYTANKELKPFVKIDLLLNPSDVNQNLIDEISKLEPFGASNPSPIFAMNNLKLKQKRLMGSDNSHLRLNLGVDAYEFTAVRWQKGDINLSSGDSLDIAFHPQINEFNGNTSVQLVVDDIHSDSLVEEIPVKSAYKIYDNRTKTGILPNINDYIKTSKSQIRIFAESKYILDTVKNYTEIFSRTFNRLDIPKCDILMFFDYPADRETLDKILEKAQPTKVHFMKYEPKFLDESEFLKTFTGMVKFAAHNNGGKIELVRCASFLGKSIKVFERLLELYEEVGFLKITDKNNAFYVIEFLGIDDLSKILHNEKYAQIFDMIIENETFQKTLLEDDLEQLLSV